MFFKRFTEVMLIGKTAEFGNNSDLVIRLPQKFFRIIHPCRVQKFLKGDA